MVIRTNNLDKEIITEENGKQAFTMMDVALIHLKSNDSFKVEKIPIKETAIQLVEGELDFKVNGKTYSAKRGGVFESPGFVLHIPFNVEVQLTSKSYAEILIISTSNKNSFDIEFYSPEDVLVQRFGVDVWDNTGIRDVLTFFDYDNAPYSNLVIGEVFSLPGRWSSYIPHSHPQPEIYYYRFDKPQGFGAAFINYEASAIYDKNFLLIPGGNTHPQCAAPGYALYFSWIIRHLDGNPWKKTRNVDPKHSWLEEKDILLWKGFKK